MIDNVPDRRPAMNRRYSGALTLADLSRLCAGGGGTTTAPDMAVILLWIPDASAHLRWSPAWA